MLFPYDRPETTTDEDAPVTRAQAEAHMAACGVQADEFDQILTNLGQDAFEEGSGYDLQAIWAEAVINRMGVQFADGDEGAADLVDDRVEAIFGAAEFVDVDRAASAIDIDLLTAGYGDEEDDDEE